jgi:hypothetical protein
MGVVSFLHTKLFSMCVTQRRIREALPKARRKAASRRVGAKRGAKGGY